MPKNYSIQHGHYNDTFSIVNRSSSGCAKFQLDALELLYNGGQGQQAVLGMLSCSNNAFEIDARFGWAP